MQSVTGYKSRNVASQNIIVRFSFAPEFDTHMGNNANTDASGVAFHICSYTKLVDIRSLRKP